MKRTADWLLGRVFVVPEWTTDWTRTDHLVTVTVVGTRDNPDELRGFVHTNGQTQVYDRGFFCDAVDAGIITVSTGGVPEAAWRPGSAVR